MDETYQSPSVIVSNLKGQNDSVQVTVPNKNQSRKIKDGESKIFELDTVETVVPEPNKIRSSPNPEDVVVVEEGGRKKVELTPEIRVNNFGFVDVMIQEVNN